ncbi:MAG: 2,3,4,5-tetrahydropyridine-2,6-dicarboxylate N-succinyltransferase [Candidatus Ancillula sp.]|jgi:2,3,4,5-tetrahydropyridine-2-carboxylate N-succinyltransferase|nr:2,3,4,5-tetrahydropyridine-2,6-dicarboxylate N-succinyltransferase [Candidatus Ancillula sp.]
MVNDNVPEFGFGWGLVTFDAKNNVLDTYFPELTIGDNKYADTAKLSAEVKGVPDSLKSLEGEDAYRRVKRVAKFIISSLQFAPESTEDVYLRLHALSMRLCVPNSINLEGVYNLLNNVVWTNYGPCAVEDFETVRLQLASKFGLPPTVLLIDKFPRMVDYVIPSGVRIGNADRIRLGAHLAEGTTVMHEGFCNFNAGTLGTSMVEGRISQGVTVGDGTDIGGGASIMGTLSGGGEEVVSLGKRSLLGANAGLGIPLGDDCVVEAGLYITAGTKVLFEGELFKARDLAFANSLLFMRNSQTGKVEVKRRKNHKAGVVLNSALHSNKNSLSDKN